MMKFIYSEKFDIDEMRGQDSLNFILKYHGGITPGSDVIKGDGALVVQLATTAGIEVVVNQDVFLSETRNPKNPGYVVNSNRFAIFRRVPSTTGTSTGLRVLTDISLLNDFLTVKTASENRTLLLTRGYHEATFAFLQEVPFVFLPFRGQFISEEILREAIGRRAKKFYDYLN